MSKVIILGAGSSKDCGLPLGDEVWPYFKHYSGPPWYRFLCDIFPQFTRGVDKYPTFELVLTLIENHIKNKQNLGSYSYADLMKVKQSLVDSYVEVFYKKCLYAEYKHSDYSLMPDAKYTYDNFNQWYKPFFSSFIKEAKNENIVFISLNYDVLIDLVLHNLVDNNEIESFTYGFDIYNLHSQDEKCRTTGILLLKPHGSINLAQCKKCRKIFCSIFSAQGNSSIINSYKCNTCDEKLDAFILAPMFNKANEGEPFAIIHKKTSEVIASASEILIVGYSLPDYDVNILEAFLRGMVKNQNRFKLKIEIVDKSNDINARIKSKYNNIFHRITKENYYIDGFKKYTEQLCSVIKK